MGLHFDPGLRVHEVGLPCFTGEARGGRGNSSRRRAYVERARLRPGRLDAVPAGGTASAPAEGELCTITGTASTPSSPRAARRSRTSPPRRAVRPGRTATTSRRRRTTSAGATSARSSAAQGADDQLKYDRFDWKLERLGTHRLQVHVRGRRRRDRQDRHRRASARSSSNVDTTVTNLADAPKKHRFSIEAFAYRTNKRGQGQARARLAVRDRARVRARRRGQAEAERRLQGGLVPRAARSTATPRSRTTTSRRRWSPLGFEPSASASEPKPACALLAEEVHARRPGRDDDDSAPSTTRGSTTRRDARAEGVGDVPPDRLLRPEGARRARQGRGRRPHLGDLINLGFFSPVAKVLVRRSSSSTPT